MNKKFALLLVLLAALVMGSVSSAAAAEIKASGQWQVDAQWVNNLDFQKKGAISQDKDFNIGQRMRTAFVFIANENLRGILETQIGTGNWGNGMFAIGSGRGTTNNVAAAGGTATSAGNGGNGNLMLRKGYIDFKWPNTQVNFLVGFQTLSLPSAVGGGSPVLDDQFAAAAVVVPVTDGVSLVGGYGRLFDANSAATATASTLSGSGTTTDAAFLIANLDFKGVSVRPWAAYATSGAKTASLAAGATALDGFRGSNSSMSEGLRAYWGGAAFTMTAFDPFKVMADFNYGKATWRNGTGTSTRAEGGRAGWLADIAIDYTGLSMMTPSLFAAYSSGESGNSTNGGKSDRMPVVGSPQNYALGSFFLGGGDTLSGTIGTPETNMGYWAVGLSLKDIKLIDKLSHTFHVMYVKGTNDVDFLKENGVVGIPNGVQYGKFLTTKDSLWEVDFNTKYQIYDGLALGVELGYINADFDKATWGAANAQLNTYGSASAYKAAMLLNYSF
ncbi:MAG: outer membrane homotrimeric porin [Proteobacteria bacterium]|nr:outer membrane homotrimeric porin [Pseudomonadota bacterium]MBU1594443.1 outer membrane homotrimeric porin [Pseudomonadota bacterium]